MPAYDCGVLFVHGIGEQQRADTLIECADPLIRWLQRWLERFGPEGHPRGHVRVARARISAELRADTPAYVLLEITLNDGLGQPRSFQRWLLAEARWAEETRTPPFGRLAGWMLTTGAWIVLSDGLSSAREMMRAARTYTSVVVSVLKATQAILGAVALTAVLQFGLTVLLLLSVIPIPQLRGALSDVLLRASGILGDAYVLLESSVQRQAIVGSVRRSLEWVAGQCETAAVVAHSQGAAVSHRVLRDPNTQNVFLLITYGSGLAKLEELHVMNAVHRDMMQFAKYAVPLAILAALFLVRVVWVYPGDEWALRALWWCVIPASMLASLFGFAFGAPRALRRHAVGLSLLARRPKIDWLDLFATADPVPNGPLTFGGIAIDGVESRAVANRRSLLRDHTSYWENETEFIPAVLQSLDRRFGSGLFEPTASQLLRAAALGRRSRVRWLFAVRWAAIASAALVAAGVWDGLPGLGLLLLNALQTPPLSPIGAFMLASGRVPVRLIEFARGDARGVWTIVGYGVAGTILVALAVGLAYRVFFATWRWWEQLNVRALFEPDVVNPRWNILGGAAVLAVGFVPLLAGAALNARPTVETWLGQPIHVTEILVFQLLGGTFVAIYWVVIASLMRTIVTDVRTSGRKNLLETTGAVVTFVVAGLYITGLLSMGDMAQGVNVVVAAGLIVGAQRWFWHHASTLGRVVGPAMGMMPLLLTLAIISLRLTRAEIAALLSPKVDVLELAYGVLALYVCSAGLTWPALAVARRVKRVHSQAKPKSQVNRLRRPDQSPDPDERPDVHIC